MEDRDAQLPESSIISGVARPGEHIGIGVFRCEVVGGWITTLSPQKSYPWMSSMYPPPSSSTPVVPEASAFGPHVRLDIRMVHVNAAVQDRDNNQRTPVEYSHPAGAPTWKRPQLLVVAKRIGTPEGERQSRSSMHHAIFSGPSGGLPQKGSLGRTPQAPRQSGRAWRCATPTRGPWGSGVLRGLAGWERDGHPLPPRRSFLSRIPRGANALRTAALLPRCLTFTSTWLGAYIGRDSRLAA